MSRTTIREVLRQLAAEGLVATIPQRGAVVAIPTAEEAAELYEVRAALESLAARRFVEHASESQVTALRAAFEEVAEVMSAGDAADTLAMIQAKDLFYDVLLKGSGNRSIHSILSGLTARVSVLRATSMAQPGPCAAVARRDARRSWTPSRAATPTPPPTPARITSRWRPAPGRPRRPPPE